MADAWHVTHLLKLDPEGHRLLILLVVMFCNAPSRLEAQEVNCGVAAFQLVLHGYGINPRSSAVEEMGKEKSISLLQMRELFESEDLHVETFRVTRSPSRRLRQLLARLDSGSCQAVVLMPTSEALRTDIEVPGHYFVVKSWDREKAELTDSQSGQNQTIDLSKIAGLENPVAIQFVLRRYDGALYAPVTWFDGTVTIVLIGTLVVISRRSPVRGDGDDLDKRSGVGW